MPVEPLRSPHTIVLRGDLHKRHEEAVCATNIKPGYIIKKNGAGKVIPHNAAGAGGQMWVAKEETLIGGTIRDHVYLAANDDVVPYHMPQSGDVLYVRVPAAAVAIGIDGPVTSNGDGTVKLATGGDAIFGYNYEGAIVDNSAGASEIFMRVEIP